MKMICLSCILALGLASFALGSPTEPNVPVPANVTDDTAIYQNLSEIQTRRESNPNFDGDLSHLSAMEKRYREKLPALAQHPRLRGPLQRVSETKYRYSGQASGQPSGQAAGTSAKKRVAPAAPTHTLDSMLE